MPVVVVVDVVVVLDLIAAVGLVVVCSLLSCSFLFLAEALCTLSFNVNKP